MSITLCPLNVLAARNPLNEMWITDHGDLPTLISIGYCTLYTVVLYILSTGDLTCFWLKMTCLLIFIFNYQTFFSIFFNQFDVVWVL